MLKTSHRFSQKNRHSSRLRPWQVFAAICGAVEKQVFGKSLAEKDGDEFRVGKNGYLV
jgi:hypothetical protein